MGIESRYARDQLCHAESGLSHRWARCRSSGTGSRHPQQNPEVRFSTKLDTSSQSKDAANRLEDGIDGVAIIAFLLWS